MIRIVTILTFLVLMSCVQKETVSFYNECSESKLNLNNGIEVSDSLGYFSYLIPDSTWKPSRFLSDTYNGLTVGDSSQGYLRFFYVDQSNYIDDWNWKEEQKNVEKQFNVIETGEIFLNGQKRRYNIVHFKDEVPEMVSFFVTVLDTVKKRQYTIAMTAEYIENYKLRFCKMRPLMESFKIKN